ncbi:MAG: hypothetical protein FJY67_04000 [Calditrichaeota bacterium]|nr:hypothetical protein [Calditrichota bacterium]
MNAHWLKHCRLLPILICFLPASLAQAQSNPHGELSISCKECHTVEGWQAADSVRLFDHSGTAFPLEGRHRTTSCRECHRNLRFAGTPSACRACHVDVHSGQFGPTCVVCHSPQTWEAAPDMAFRHELTRFPLTGIHRGLDCRSCHSGGVFAGLSAKCFSCHIKDYERTRSPDHRAAGFSTDCSQCHSPVGAPGRSSWGGAAFVHPTSFPLVGGHQAVECATCHQSGYRGLSSDCQTCHTADYDRTLNPDHRQGRFSHDCASCHTIQGWRPARYDHDLSRFPLTGSHRSAACAACHQEGRFTGTPTACLSCHNGDFARADDPDHVRGQFDSNCALCHSTDDWKPATFDHALSRFPLTGAHRRTECAECHTGGVWQGTPQDCYSCHRSDYERSADPDHRRLNYSLDCTDCHTTDDWDVRRIDHDRTPFPLTGKHRLAECAECHTGGRYTGTTAECGVCHRDDFEGARQPDHSSGRFSSSCQTCHTTEGWRPASFDHALARFLLSGAHRRTECALCHAGGIYTGTPAECYACHRDDFEGARQPDHSSGRFSSSCQTCHSSEGWRPATFDHALARFPLAGAHRRTECASCHVGGIYTGTPLECYVCHRDDFEGVADPGHQAGNFDRVCTTCHSLEGWRPAAFDHTGTDFRLTGAHRNLDCNRCHQNRFTGTGAACRDCHLDDYARTLNPEHYQAAFPDNCMLCHQTNRWRPAAFDHSRARFILTGGHRSVSCVVCHSGGRYTGTPVECYACHRDDFEGVSDPDHRNGNYDHTCTVCHTTEGWTPATFDHSRARFILTGAHLRTDCAECHTGGRYSGTPVECYACHRDDFEGVSDPDHRSGNYDHTCTVCHTTEGWTPALFDHSATRFPLTGAHRIAGCAECHIGGRYTGTPFDCFFCHRDDYENARNPNHQAAGFPQACASCHSTAAWDPANFNHDAQWFPIYTGRHRGEWDGVCSSCHTNPNDFRIFTCIDCHEHRRDAMDREHREEPRYEYNSAACYRCHPRGEALLMRPKGDAGRRLHEAR